MSTTISYDLQPDATYIHVSDGPIARTVTVSDLVMVDLDAKGEPVGVEFAVPARMITDAMRGRLADLFPDLKLLVVPELLGW